MIATKSNPPAKPGGLLFISRASADDAFVRQLRAAIEGRHLLIERIRAGGA